MSRGYLLFTYLHFLFLASLSIHRHLSPARAFKKPVHAPRQKQRGLPCDGEDMQSLGLFAALHQYISHMAHHKPAHDGIRRWTTMPSSLLWQRSPGQRGARRLGACGETQHETQLMRWHPSYRWDATCASTYTQEDNKGVPHHCGRLSKLYHADSTQAFVVWVGSSGPSMVPPPGPLMWAGSYCRWQGHQGM